MLLEIEAAPVTQSGLFEMTAPVPPSDEELVKSARGGSRTAFEALVRRHQRPLYYLCHRYVRDPDAAADLVQRAFVRVLEKLDDLRADSTFRSWLFRIGANLALNHIRDHARFVDEEAAAADEVAPLSHPDAQLEAAELGAALRHAVALLPTKQRMTLELRVYEELSFRDIAAALDTTEGAAKVNFHYAVRRLRSLMSDPTAGKAKTPRATP